MSVTAVVSFLIPPLRQGTEDIVRNAMKKRDSKKTPCLWCNANKEDNVDLCEDCIRLRYTGGRFMACCPCGVVFDMGPASMCDCCLIELGLL